MLRSMTVAVSQYSVPEALETCSLRGIKYQEALQNDRLVMRGG